MKHEKKGLKKKVYEEWMVSHQEFHCTTCDHDLSVLLSETMIYYYKSSHATLHRTLVHSFRNFYFTSPQ